MIPLAALELIKKTAIFSTAACKSGSSFSLMVSMLRRPEMAIVLIEISFLMLAALLNTPEFIKSGTCNLLY